MPQRNISSQEMVRYAGTAPRAKGTKPRECLCIAVKEVIRQTTSLEANRGGVGGLQLRDHRGGERIELGRGYSS